MSLIERAEQIAAAPMDAAQEEERLMETAAEWEAAARGHMEEVERLTRQLAGAVRALELLLPWADGPDEAWMTPDDIARRGVALRMARDLLGAVGVRQWINAARTVLVTEYPDGTMVVAFRHDRQDPWGPPITVRPDPEGQA